MDLHPSLALKLTKTVTLTPDLDFFWRQNKDDGVYNVSGALLRSGRTSSARFIGSHANTTLEWAVNRHWTVTGVYLHFFPGAFLKETKPDRPVTFAALWISYRF